MTFDPVTALNRCRLSRYTYDDWKETKRQVKELGYVEFREFEDNEHDQAYVATKNDRIVVCFRGTANILNWLKNVRFIKTNLDSRKFPGVRVHRGFLSATAKIGEDITDHVRSLLKKNPRPVEVVGHSLGGAMAEIWAFLNETADAPHKIPIHQVHTFGAPRVGNRRWQQEYSRSSLGNRTQRITLAADPVPAVPKLFYRPVGRHIHICRKGTVWCDPSPWWYWLDRRIVWAKQIWLSGRPWKLLPDLIYMHVLDTGYLPALKRLTK